MVAGIACCFIPGLQILGVSLIVNGASGLISNTISASGANGKTAILITSALNIIAGVFLCFTPFACVGASMIGSGVGSIAGGYISESLGGTFEFGAGIGGIVGGIVGGQIHNKISNYLRSTVVVDNKRVPVYRGGNDMELSAADIRQYIKTDGMKGLSLNSDPNNVNIINHGGAYRVKNIPKGLKIVFTGGTHYTLVPISSIDVESYQKLLYLVKLIGGK